MLDQPGLVAGLVVGQLIDQPGGHQDAEPALAEPAGLADGEVGERVVGVGGVG
jgi:hypothetical protein